MPLVRHSPPGPPAPGAWRHAAAALVLGALLAAPAPLAAQLRPLEPLGWSILHGDQRVSVRVGMGIHYGQKASLAGLEGRLIEAGEIRVDWRTGRVLLEAGGTLQRLFEGYSRFAGPVDGAGEADGERLHDSGAWRIATVIRFTEPDAPALLTLRFGTRLPNPDNRVGLDRDQTDFFALVGAGWRRSALSLGAELGLGINGTRNPDYEQSDVVLYTAVAEFRHRALAPRFTLTGQYDGNRRAMLRGNEDLSEARLGLRLGQRWWVEADAVRGLASHSPSFGILVAMGRNR
jgi:hypothetical protein